MKKIRRSIAYAKILINLQEIQNTHINYRFRESRRNFIPKLLVTIIIITMVSVLFLSIIKY